MNKQYYKTAFNSAETAEQEVIEKLVSLKISLKALVRSVEELDINNAKRDVGWIQECYNLNDAKELLEALDEVDREVLEA